MFGLKENPHEQFLVEVAVNQRVLARKVSWTHIGDNLGSTIASRRLSNITTFSFVVFCFRVQPPMKRSSNFEGSIDAIYFINFITHTEVNNEPRLNQPIFNSDEPVVPRAVRSSRRARPQGQ